MRKIFTIIITGLLAVVLTVIQIKIVHTASKPEEKTKAVIFKREIDAKTEITDNMISVKKVDKTMLPPDYCSKRESVVSKFLLHKAYKGEIVIDKMLSDENPKDNKLLYKMNKENVFISIKPDGDKAVAWQLKPDQLVDLIFTYNTDDKKNERLENIRIAGIADEEYKQVKFNLESKDVTLEYLILEVSNKQAEKIALAKIAGTIEVVRIN